MKILDKVVHEHLNKLIENKDGNKNKTIYIGSSKLFCYDCQLIKKAINKFFENNLKISFSEEKSEDQEQSAKFFQSRGTHGLEFSSNWLLPKLVLDVKFSNVLKEYLRLKSNTTYNTKGIQYFDSSLSDTP